MTLFHSLCGSLKCPRLQRKTFAKFSTRPSFHKEVLPFALDPFKQQDYRFFKRSKQQIYLSNLARTESEYHPNSG